MKRTMMREVAQYLGILAAVGAVVFAARTAEAGDAAFLLAGNGFKEECVDEGGCSSEESRELYVNGDYNEECIGEGCSFAEKVELACGAGPIGVAQCGGSPGTWVNRMQNHWCARGRVILCSDLFGNSFSTSCIVCP